MRRNGEIDLLKFLFGMMIVFYHGRIFCDPERVLFGAGFIGGEFFFLVSGYLMAEKAKHVSQKENLPSGKETADFILKKVKMLMPHVLFAYVVGVIVHCALTSNLEGSIRRLVYTVWEPFMLWTSGLGNYDLQINAQTWYISAMLLSMLVLYPIMIRNFDLFTRVIAPATAIFLFGWMAKEYGTLNHYRIWSGIAYSGILRAIAALSLGCVCWEVSQRVKCTHFTKAGRLRLSAVEVASYLLVAVGANFEKQRCWRS